jgi:hypothetical protein
MVPVKRSSPLPPKPLSLREELVRYIHLFFSFFDLANTPEGKGEFQFYKAFEALIPQAVREETVTTMIQHDVPGELFELNMGNAGRTLHDMMLIYVIARVNGFDYATHTPAQLIPWFEEQVRNGTFKPKEVIRKVTLDTVLNVVPWGELWKVFPDMQRYMEKRRELSAASQSQKDELMRFAAELSAFEGRNWIMEQLVSKWGIWEALFPGDERNIAGRMTNSSWILAVVMTRGFKTEGKTPADLAEWLDKYLYNPAFFAKQVQKLAESNPNFDRVVDEINIRGTKGGVGGGTPGLMDETRADIITKLRRTRLPQQASGKFVLFTDDTTEKGHRDNSNLIVWALRMLGMPLTESTNRKSVTNWVAKHLK